VDPFNPTRNRLFIIHNMLEYGSQRSLDLAAAVTRVITLARALIRLIVIRGRDAMRCAIAHA
jgi:hypothetical protein